MDDRQDPALENFIDNLQFLFVLDQNYNFVRHKNLAIVCKILVKASCAVCTSK